MINKYSKLTICTFLALGNIDISFDKDILSNNFYDEPNVISVLSKGFNWAISVNKAHADNSIERIPVYGRPLPPIEWDWNDFDFGFDDWMDSDWGSDGGGGGGNSSPDDECAGNPIIVASGEKVEFETDFIGKEQYPLEIARKYSSKNNAEGAFGKGWSSSFDKRFDVNTKTLHRGDGKSVRLYAGSFDVPYIGQKTGYKSSSGKNYIYQDGTGHWIFRNESDQNEVYDSQGRLVQISFSERPDQLVLFGALQVLSYGISHTYSYGSNGKIATITHANGRKLTLSWNGNKITHITDNAGNIYQYAYNASGMLTSVRFPDGKSRTYHYEDTRFPVALTGVSIGTSRYS